MTARTWHGAVPAEKAEAYHAYLLRTGVPDYRATPGNRGVLLLRRAEPEAAHYVLLTLWNDLAAVRAFAGDDVERARYYPEDAAFLLEMEPAVAHHDVRVEPTWDAIGGVARVWHGWAAPAQADAYEALLRTEIFHAIADRGMAGFRGIALLRRDGPGETEFVTVMGFDDLAAVRAFAGADYEAAVVPEKARALLARFDARALHYDVLATEPAT
jgi:heme-degrading monooxygenase HmoA